MSDIELVIKISKEVHNHISNANSIPDILGIDIVNVINAVKNGISLPKGHGRLIDETDLKTLFGLDDRLWWENAVERFIDLPTIIEADKESEEKQEQIRDKKMIDAIDFAIKATDTQDDYSMGMRNGMRYVKSLIDGKEPQYESRRTNEEKELGIDIGDEVIGAFGSKGVVVGICSYEGEVQLSLLMGNHTVPQLVKASNYKTKTGRHFPQIAEVLEQMKGEADGK